MTTDLLHSIHRHGAAVDLSSRAKFRFTGGDRVRYLNGQITNDVRRATAEGTLYACVTDAKGHIAGDGFVHAQAEALLLDAEPGLRESLGLRLERYIVADEVELMDVTEAWQLWHVWGSAAGQQAAALRSMRFGVAGVDLWLPAAAAPPVFDSCPVLDESDLETWRILQQVPRWPQELNEETFPPEAGIEDRALDFAKGCYIGQEVLSRIRTTGKMPRKLIAWESALEVKAGEALLNAEGNAVGKVTSVTRDPLSGGSAGLAFLKQSIDPNAVTLAGAPLRTR